MREKNGVRERSKRMEMERDRERFKKRESQRLGQKDTQMKI